MPRIHESKNFIVDAVDEPHIDRKDGGHIQIYPMVRTLDRQRLPARHAIELMRLTVVVGQAMTKIMNEHGVDVGRVNYQDNGNWGVFDTDDPHLHVHIYGRAISAQTQIYGEACFFPNIDEEPEFYRSLKPLSKTDVRDIGAEVERLLAKDEFSDSTWGLH